MANILIIDDDLDLCMILERYLSKKGFDTQAVHNGQQAIELLRKDKFDLALVDFKLPDLNGIELLEGLKKIEPSIQVIIITGYSDVKVAVNAIKKGAYDYVTKPIQQEEILSVINKALKPEPKEQDTRKKKNEPRQFTDFISGQSKPSKKINEMISLVAPTNMSVVIEGETGSGKEFVARAIHEKSKRSSQPFEAVDCGALPKDLAESTLFGHKKGSFTGATTDQKGHFELADGGTLFLDEIGNLSYASQVKLLRALQEKKIRPVGGNKDVDVDVRVLAASNEDLKEAVIHDKFREDLYHRINEFKITIPPLRQRREDLMMFATHFLQSANEELEKAVEGFDEEAENILIKYHWHGNLRELKNVVKRAVLLAKESTITRVCLPDEIIHYSPEKANTNDSIFNTPTNLKSASEIAEREVIIKTLQESGYNKTKAAKLLDIDRKTLYNKIKTYDIELND